VSGANKLHMTQALTLIRAFGVSRLATELGVTHGAVSQWRRIPAERVLDVERITGVGREELRPDLYPPPREEAKQ
jgi:DNA-binding transcriptional regulator YdaS (Cro superfamily)